MPRRKVMELKDLFSIMSSKPGHFPAFNVPYYHLALLHYGCGCCWLDAIDLNYFQVITFKFQLQSTELEFYK